MKPEVVVFDLGRVLLDFDYRIVARRLGPSCRGGETALLESLHDSALLHGYEKGTLSSEAFFGKIQEASGLDCDFAEFSAVFADIFTEIPPMVELNARLRWRGTPTFLLSNTNAIQAGHIRQQYPFFAQFDGYILSFEHGAMKPDPVLYESTERLVGRDGPRIFYLDDRAENVAAGATRGWQAVLHQNPEASWAAVQAAGLLD